MPASSKPSSRVALIQYCLRALGDPVVEINVDADQIEDRLEEALQFFQEFHSDGVRNGFYSHKITADDIANRYIILPDEVMTVTRVLPLKKAYSNGEEIFDMNYLMERDIAWNVNYGIGSMKTGMGDLEMQRQYLALVKNSLDNPNHNISFYRHMNQLNININWGEFIKEGEYIVIEGSMIIDPDTNNKIWNDMMLKKYLIALLKRQWGQNMLKWDGVQLPGGVTISGRALYDNAVEDIAKLEEGFMSKYQAPPVGFVG